jgi:hypothetical protein
MLIHFHSTTKDDQFCKGDTIVDSNDNQLVYFSVNRAEEKYYVMLFSFRGAYATEVHDSEKIARDSMKDKLIKLGYEESVSEEISSRMVFRDTPKLY